ncbi:unnamed protein product (macronuclear) [Paramecium tetraurelia]|uniref:Transmembrane protein n=1 Tax=Paramecium tetraurelia TaxID=5888 RepID=A0CVU2_PARTE|nr:uncharacterized protein GSPATT00001111001 [Paramecium tetraurelia]CAK74909.1 unnamed protein product [Paramecium tetraurelia]|eukprot:XP_001442306.1 hypothetical protein (macronuclear) [Paramecium tetraurelia strain d4-2]
MFDNQVNEDVDFHNSNNNYSIYALKSYILSSFYQFYYQIVQDIFYLKFVFLINRSQFHLIQFDGKFFLYQNNFLVKVVFSFQFKLQIIPLVFHIYSHFHLLLLLLWDFQNLPQFSIPYLLALFIQAYIQFIQF